jgi:hypothetical protein
MATTGTQPCKCRALVRYDPVYDLREFLKRPPGSELLEEVSLWEIRCRLCGRQWSGEGLEGGGIYGDTLWREAPRKPHTG